MVEPISSVLHQAAELTASGRAGKAIALLKPITVEHPYRQDVWCRLAAAHLDRGDPAAALAAATRALPLGGDRALAQRLASRALSGLHRHREAVTAARRAARLAPSDWRCPFALAEALAAARRWPEALAAARRSVELGPTQVRPYLLLGDAAVRIRDFSTAERAYRAALRKAPDDSRIRVQLTRLRRRVPDARPADRPDITQLFQQSARPVCAVVVGLITLLVVAGGSRPAPLLAWGGLVLPPVVAVLALAALVRAPSGSRLALAAAPCRSPLAALACVLLVSALGLALWWAVLINAGSQTIITLVLAWICAAGAGGLTFVRSGWPADR